jgi:hypothetical protein
MFFTNETEIVHIVTGKQMTYKSIFKRRKIRKKYRQKYIKKKE